jgi:cytochrome c5
MSDAHDAHHNAPHEGPIKTPKQLVVTIIASFLIPILVIIMLINFVASGNKSAAGTAALEPQAVAERIMPVGGVTLKLAAAGGGAPRTGEQVFQAVCAGCHAAGALGAPKLGDAGAWAPRIATGYDALLNSATKGKNAMPAKGGASDLPDLEVARAVVYMANKGGAKFAEPAAPAAK